VANVPRQVHPPRTERLSSWGATAVATPFTEWIPCVAIDTIQVAMIMAALATAGTGAVAQLAYQTATVRVDNPDAWASIPGGLSLSSAMGNASGSITISGVTAGKTWIRFGILFSASGTAPAAADVSLALSYVDLGGMLGSWRGPLTATVANDSFMAVTGWVPALLAQQVMAAVQVAAATAGFQHKLVYRLATYSQNLAGSWVAAEANVGGNCERNTGRLPLTLGANMWIQLGIAWSTSGATATADVAISIGARRS
jgi:hypothetical protein